MQARVISILFVLAGLVLPLQAQQNTPTAAAVSQEMISDTLQALGMLALRQNETFNFELQNRPVALVRIDGGNRLLIKASFKQQPSLETLNRYNEQLAPTTRAIRRERVGVMLETGVDCQFGMTAAGLEKLLKGFGAEIAAFENFLDKNQEKDKSVTGKKKVPLDIVPKTDDREFVITFPTNETNWETAWKIVWDIETGKQANEQKFKFSKGRESANVLFKIKKAYFKPGQKADWIQVLEDAHPSEFYVPYYFVNTRFFDLRSVGGYTKLSEKEGGLVSQTLGKSHRVMAELRDRGVVYKHGNWTRRGEELTLWANFVAGNYTYLVEFGFHDDGTIVFRHAPTGWNYYNHFNASHMHGSYWRVGVKLGPDGNNTKNQVHVVRLPKSPKDQENSKGSLVMDEVKTESFHDWDAREFTRIRVTNPYYKVVPDAKDNKDRPPLPIAYDLVTLVQGIARHERFKDEKFTHHDFWVTRHDCPEKMYVNLGDYFQTKTGEPNPKLLPLKNENVVLWHSSAGLHTPRAEDGIIGGAGSGSGQALVYWTSFELRPRNLFVKTPIYRQMP
jgi:primary-amine oxidase